LAIHNPKKQNKSVVIVVVTHYDSHTGFLFSLSRGRMIRGGRTEEGNKRDYKLLSALVNKKDRRGSR
jgi:hypothetical protein